MTDVEARSHLVQIYDLGILPEEGNRGYFVMEYVKGTELREQFESFGKSQQTNYSSGHPRFVMRSRDYIR